MDEQMSICRYCGKGILRKCAEDHEKHCPKRGDPEIHSEKITEMSMEGGIKKDVADVDSVFGTLDNIKEIAKEQEKIFDEAYDWKKREKFNSTKQRVGHLIPSTEIEKKISSDDPKKEGGKGKWREKRKDHKKELKKLKKMKKKEIEYTIVTKDKEKKMVGDI